MRSAAHKLSASIYAILFVTTTTKIFDRALEFYLDDLVRAKQISRWTSLVQRNFRIRSLLVDLGAGQDLVVVRI